VSREPFGNPFSIGSFLGRGRDLKIARPVHPGFVVPPEPDKQVSDIEQCLEITGIEFNRPFPVIQRHVVVALLGRDDAALYDGSWNEWGNRSELPLEQ